MNADGHGADCVDEVVCVHDIAGVFYDVIYVLGNVICWATAI